jgi:hypothetical protein
LSRVGSFSKERGAVFMSMAVSKLIGQSIPLGQSQC